MIVVDIGTTGSDPQRHSIVSIGAVEYENHKNQFYGECRVFNGAEIDGEALKINGFTRGEITNELRQPHEKLLRKFTKWAYGINDHTLAGQDAGKSDLLFIEHSLKRYSIPNRFGDMSVDLHTLSYEYLKRNGASFMETTDNKLNGHSSLSLNYTLMLTGLDEEPLPHHALTGAKLKAEAFSRLMRGRSLFEDYSKYKLPDTLRDKTEKRMGPSLHVDVSC